MCFPFSENEHSGKLRLQQQEPAAKGDRFNGVPQSPPVRMFALFDRGIRLQSLIGQEPVTRL